MKRQPCKFTVLPFFAEVGAFLASGQLGRQLRHCRGGGCGGMGTALWVQGDENGTTDGQRSAGGGRHGD